MNFLDIHTQTIFFVSSTISININNLSHFRKIIVNYLTALRGAIMETLIRRQCDCNVFVSLASSGNAMHIYNYHFILNYTQRLCIYIYVFTNACLYIQSTWILKANWNWHVLFTRKINAFKTRQIGQRLGVLILCRVGLVFLDK